MSDSTGADHGTGVMPFAIRPLRAGDIRQSVEVERDAFPTLLPPTSFHRELRNRKASYLVAVRSYGVEPDVRRVSRFPDHSGSAEEGVSVRSLLRRAFGVSSPGSAGAVEEEIVGFEGTMYVVDEAHIVSVGVRSRYRGRGIGELLLIAAIEQATARHTRVATLEVRPSNEAARNLYLKHGFVECGVRRGYYADNREDAIIMTTEPIQTSSYQKRFRALKRQHQQRWGCTELALV